LEGFDTLGLKSFTCFLLFLVIEKNLNLHNQVFIFYNWENFFVLSKQFKLILVKRELAHTCNLCLKMKI